MAKKEFPGLTRIPGSKRPINRKSYTIRARVAETIQSYGSIRKSEKIAYKNYLEGIKSGNKSYLPWKRAFENGKIYIFKYDPKLKDELDFYDKNPVVLSLGRKKIKQGYLNLGINLNFLPLRFRLSLLEQVEVDSKVIKQTEKIKGKKAGNSKLQPSLKTITYDWAKFYLEHLGFAFALRSYYTNRIGKSHQISYEEWDSVAMLNIVDMEKLSINEVKQLFNKYYLDNKKK